VPYKILHIWVIMGLSVFVILTGCTSLSLVKNPAVKPVVSEELPSGNGWWQVWFRMNWPPETEPVWHLDLYLAHQVIMPVLEKHKNDIHLWRFHRRAKRDRAGRRFTFWFYTTPAAAQKIVGTLRSDPIVINCLAAGLIDEVLYDTPTKIKRPDIEDTSDKNWPAVIQKTWPYYIDGVSQMWLNLVAQVADQDMADRRPESLEEIDRFYSRVNETVTQLWQRNGRHAFMHHLNAVFGYQPLIYWEKRMMKF